MTRAIQWTTLALFLIALAGCSDDSTPSVEDAGPNRDAIEDTKSTTPDKALTDTGSDLTQTQDTQPPACDRTGFEKAAEDAGPFTNAFLYLAQDSLGEPVSVLSMQLLESGGANTVGTYALTDANYSSCVNCVTIFLDCDANLANCSKSFLAQEGTLNITSFGAPGAQFTGTLEDVVLREVTIDEANVSTLVPDGETWCLQEFNFDAVIQ